VSFRKHAASGVCQGHGESAPVLKTKDERRPNQASNVVMWRKVERPFDSMRPRDRQPVACESLVPRNLVAHLGEHFTLPTQFTHTGVFFDEFHVGS
jgi:hypothetical protein